MSSPRRGVVAKGTCLSCLSKARGEQHGAPRLARAIRRLGAERVFNTARRRDRRRAARLARTLAYRFPAQQSPSVRKLIADERSRRDTRSAIGASPA